MSVRSKSVFPDLGDFLYTHPTEKCDLFKRLVLIDTSEGAEFRVKTSEKGVHVLMESVFPLSAKQQSQPFFCELLFEYKISRERIIHILKLGIFGFTFKRLCKTVGRGKNKYRPISVEHIEPSVLPEHLKRIQLVMALNRVLLSQGLGIEGRASSAGTDIRNRAPSLCGKIVT